MRALEHHALKELQGVEKGRGVSIQGSTRPIKLALSLRKN